MFMIFAGASAIMFVGLALYCYHPIEKRYSTYLRRRDRRFQRRSR